MDIYGPHASNYNTHLRAVMASSSSSSSSESLECTSRCYLLGLSTFALTFSATYFVQKSATLRLRGGVSAGAIVATSAFFGVVGGYLVADTCRKDCEKTARMARETRMRMEAGRQG